MANINQKRLLIFGAGVIGSLYALKFAQSGLDVTLMARGERLELLQREGLRYNDNGTIKYIAVKTIGKLENDDIYDFIFVCVRYDQAESALAAIKHNQSKTIVTLTNTLGYDRWVEIVGDRLLPGFPGAGGDLRNGVLYGQFGSKDQPGTIFGEINGQQSARVLELAKLFDMADLHYEVQEDIQAFHISHAALAVVNKHFYTNEGMVPLETARSEGTLSKLAADLKQNISLLAQAGISVTPPETRLMGELPQGDIIARYRQWLSDAFIIDVKLGDHAVKAKAEIMLLDEVFHQKLSILLGRQFLAS